MSSRIEHNHAPEPLWETDWLGSRPIYFAGSKASQSMVEVIRHEPNISLHNEGLYRYLLFGYSMGGQSPIHPIKIMKPHSRLVRSPQGTLEQVQEPDVATELARFKVAESDLPDLFRSVVRNWERALPTNVPIILPLSGGMDSRMLLWAVENRDRVSAFTYGLSSRQKESFEVTTAEQVARKQRIRWRHIELGAVHPHLDRWCDLVGPSTHAHGMYQIDFYKSIKEIHDRGAVLSGIVGDLFAGSFSPIRIDQTQDLLRLGLRRNLHASEKLLAMFPAAGSLGGYIREHRSNLADPRLQIVELVRLKMTLLSYLLRLPEAFGFLAWGPFLDESVALAVLGLPRSRRENRRWQHDFLRREGLGTEGFRVGSRQNSLNLGQFARHGVPSNSLANLESLLGREFIDELRRLLAPGPAFQFLAKSRSRAVSGILDRSRQMRAYRDFLVLYPLSHISRQRPDLLY